MAIRAVQSLGSSQPETDPKTRLWPVKATVNALELGTNGSGLAVLLATEFCGDAMNARCEG